MNGGRNKVESFITREENEIRGYAPFDDKSPVIVLFRVIIALALVGATVGITCCIVLFA